MQTLQLLDHMGALINSYSACAHRPSEVLGVSGMLWVVQQLPGHPTRIFCHRFPRQSC